MLDRFQDTMTDPLRVEKIAYFKSKLRSLRELVPLVERQISLHGNTYSCVDPGYVLLMYDLNYPTFAALARSDEIKWLWDKLERKSEVSVVKVLEITLGPGVALALGIMGFWKTGLRRK